jgi:hypothetical protein
VAQVNLEREFYERESRGYVKFWSPFPSTPFQRRISRLFEFHPSFAEEDTDPDWEFLVARRRAHLFFPAAPSSVPFVRILPPNARLVDQQGFLVREWWRYFQALQRELDDLRKKVNSP